MSLLIIEDDPALLRLLQAIMRYSTVTVESATSGSDALREIESGRHDAVILDLMLPGMTGFDILRSLRAKHPHLLSRIIVLTAVSQATLENEFDMQSSIWKLVRKPFDVDELMKAISGCIAYHSAHGIAGSRELTVWLQKQCARTGASGGVIALCAQPRKLELRASHGFPVGLLEGHFPLPSEENYPICSSVRSGNAVWIDSFRKAAYPLLPIWKANESKSMAAVPLKKWDLVTGAMGWTFRDSQRFDPLQLKQLAEISAEAFEMVGPPPDQPQINR